MPKFFFHLQAESLCLSDHKGSDFQDVAAAKFFAKSTARDLAAAQLRTHPANRNRIDIADRTGAIVASVAISAA